jgi:excisionase family DNA binding protein
VSDPVVYLRGRARARRDEIADAATATLADVNRKLGLPEERQIVEFVQRGTGRDAEFDIRLADRTLIEIASASALLHPQKFESSFAVAAIVWDEGFSRKEQKRLAEALLRVRVVVGGDERDQTREWLAEWFDTCGIGDRDGIPRVDLDNAADKFRALEDDIGFFRGGDDRVYVRRPRFVDFVNRSLGERLSSIAIGKRLERLGFAKAGENREGRSRRDTASGRSPAPSTSRRRGGGHDRVFPRFPLSAWCARGRAREHDRKQRKHRKQPACNRRSGRQRSETAGKQRGYRNRISLASLHARDIGGGKRGRSMTPAQTSSGPEFFEAKIHTNDRLLTADDLAARWQVPKSHVYRLARGARIPTVRLGRYYRFRLAAVEAFELEGGVSDA